MDKITIIDGNSLLFRAFYATSYPPERMMKTKSGIYTNAIVAFGNMLLKVLSSVKLGEGFVVVFDSDEKTIRHLEDKEYKAQRKKAPDELIMQFPLARKFLKAMNIMAIECPGYEGDDLAASIAKLASQDKIKVNIYTSDKDYLQLIDEYVSISILKKGLTDIVKVTNGNCEELYGLQPLEIIDYKALAGDPSDNIKGIKGIGEKTALKLIKEYHNLEAIYQYALTNQTSKTNQLIVAGIDEARHSYHLATMIHDIKLPFALNDLQYEGYDEGKILAFCQEYELNTFRAKLPLAFRKTDIVSINGPATYQLVDALDSLLLNEERVLIYLDFNKKESNYHLYEPSLIYLAFKERVFIIEIKRLLSDSIFVKLLSSKVMILTYDSKTFYHLLSKNDLKAKQVSFDFSLANYLINSEGSNDLETTIRYFNETVLVDQVDHKQSVSFSLMKLLELYPKLNSELTNFKLDKLYYQVELPLVPVLVKMEIAGIYVNVDNLDAIRRKYAEIASKIEKEIIDLAGYDLNINSPAQVKELLFEKMRLGKEKSTSVEVLKRYRDHKIVRLLLDYRHYYKVLTTYIAGLSPYLDSKNYLHTIFNQKVTSTGRLSSSEPNLQNIVTRDEDANEFRAIFDLPDKDYSYISFDYSQIELRVLAELSNCPPLIKAFRAHNDIHYETAKLVFKTDHVTPIQRRMAKVINFGIVYGISSWSLANDLEISPFEANQIINAFKDSFPEVTSYLDHLVNLAKERGYVNTLFNRRRYISDINSNVYVLREAAKRKAMNAPIQGSASDIIKLSMIAIDEFLTERKLQTKMVLQVHDELVFLVPSTEIELIKVEVKRIMETIVEMDVPLEVSTTIGRFF